MGIATPYTPGPMDAATLQAIALIILAYLVGSLPVGVLVARLTGGRDPRTVGSGRTGGTNALRAMGPARALAVGLLDIAKGAVPILVARWAGASELVQAVCGVAAVLGAWRSVFLRFHGGRGVATGIGGMLAISPLVVLLAAPFFFGVILLSGYVSLGSLLGTAAGTVITALFVAVGALPAVWLVYTLPALAIVWIAHSDNIQRLLHGEERKIVFGNREPG